MTKAYNNPYHPLPIRWIRVQEPIIYNNGAGIAYMDTDFWGNETVPDPPNYVWYPKKLITDDTIVAYTHNWWQEDKAITWGEFKTMFAKLEYNG